MQIAILKTDSVRPELVGTFGEYPEMFARLLGELDPGLSFTTYDVRAGEYPASPGQHDAYLITGSQHSVYDPLPWIEPLCAFVRELHCERRKLAGICFGHQLVAQALGGWVERHGGGWGVGVHVHEFRDLPRWHDGGSPRFRVLVSHQDQVRVPAEGSTVLARSDFCEVAACQLGEHVLTFQGHPEFSPEYLRAIIGLRLDRIPPSTVTSALASLESEPESPRIGRWLVRFLRESV